jgi:cytochrome P450
MVSMMERAEKFGLKTIHFDLENDSRFGTDPFGVWDEAADNGPLFYSSAGRGFFVAADYDTIKTVLRNTKVWSNLPTTITYTKEPIEMHTPPINMDPPEHTDYRKAIIPLFSPQVLTPLEPRIHAITNKLIDDILDKGSCQFTSDFAAKLPSYFFLEWLGLDSGDRKRMFELAELATFGFANQEERDAIDGEIQGIIRDLYALRRKSPKNDLASALTQVRMNGEPIREQTLVEIGALCFIAGQETTSTQLSYILWHLARNQHDRQRLVDEPELTMEAIEELTRVYNTGGPAGRIAKEDGELNGVPIEKGDRVFLARCGADRQMDREVKLDRKPNRHTAFGLGAHRCLGSHVARIEMKIALEVWHQRVPRYRIQDGFVPEHRYGTFMQQLRGLPLEIG